MLHFLINSGSIYWSRVHLSRVNRLHCNTLSSLFHKQLILHVFLHSTLYPLFILVHMLLISINIEISSISKWYILKSNIKRKINSVVLLIWLSGNIKVGHLSYYFFFFHWEEGSRKEKDKRNCIHYTAHHDVAVNILHKCAKKSEVGE